MNLEKKPWEDDQLDRKKDAEFLGFYLTNRFHASLERDEYSSFVLNINAEWGFGKTYFLENWRRELTAQKFPTIYFNAWNTDFSNDPLLAFISEIEEQLKPYLKKSTKAIQFLDNAINNAKRIIKPSLPILISVLSKQLTGLTQQQIYEILDKSTLVFPKEASFISEETKENVDVERELNKLPGEVVSQAVVKAVEESLAEHNSAKISIAVFKENLHDLVKHLQSLKSFIAVLMRTRYRSVA